MNITEDSSSEVHYHTRRVHFEGAPAEPYVGFIHKGKLWVPDTASARWDHEQPIQKITVSGPILKKDGTPSQNRGKREYLTPADPMWARAAAEGGWYAQAPAWLLELFGIQA
jgi:hypothetical protein